MINVFIGYDHREAIAFSVLSHSIHVRSSLPVRITPIMLSQLTSLMWRERDPLQSTDFSFSRFLTPYLSNYEGWSIFMDCDMLVLDDLAKLWQLRDDKYAVMCVKHNHQPNEDVKFLNAVQTKYQKKNWSSVMLMNNQKCRALTPDYVNSASGLELHQFKWLEGDHLIGEIPSRWNHLVGYEGVTKDSAIVHFTLGGPYFSEWHDCEFSQEWRSDFSEMLRCDQIIDSAQAT